LERFEGQHCQLDLKLLSRASLLSNAWSSARSETFKRLDWIGVVAGHVP
jgi:hypothetical protein